MSDNISGSVGASSISGIGPAFLQYPVLYGNGSSSVNAPFGGIVWITGGSESDGYTVQDVNDSTPTAGLPTKALDGAIVTLGSEADVPASSDTATATITSLFKRALQHLTQNGSNSTVTLAGSVPSGNNTIGVVVAYQGGTPWGVSGTITVNQGTHGSDPWEVTLSAGSASTPLGSVTSYQGGIWNIGITGISTVSVSGTVTVAGTVTANAGIGTFTTSGSSTVTQGTSPWVDNITQLGSNAIALGAGTTTTGTPRVVLASDQTVSITGAVSLGAGSSTIGSVTLNPGTALVGKVGIDQTTPGTTNRVSLGTDTINASLVGTSTTIISGNVFTQAAQGTLTDRSGTITSGGTAQTLAASNASRKYLFIQNNSAGNLWFNFTTTAVQSQPSVLLLPNASVTFVSPYITTEAVSIIGATTSATFTAKEG